MKGIIFSALSFIVLIAVAFAADCEIDGYKFNRGEKHQPAGRCTLITCIGHNSVSELGCADEQTLEPCTIIPEDQSKPWPDCCPRFEC